MSHIPEYIPNKKNIPNTIPAENLEYKNNIPNTIPAENLEYKKTYKIIKKPFNKTQINKKKKYQLNINSFHIGNNENCFNFAIVNYAGEDYKLKIITKSPITGIIENIYKKNKFECIITLSSKDNTFFFDKLFKQSSLFVRCYITPNVRKLDKDIIEKLKKTLLLKRERSLEYIQYNNYLKFLERKKNIFDYNKLYKNDYKYYYCLYCYLFIKFVENDENLDLINNEELIIFIKRENEINTIEEYLDKIYEFNKIQDLYYVEKMKKYNFISVNKHFILIPSYDNIITINDILSLLKDNIEYLNFKLQIIYRYDIPLIEHLEEPLEPLNNIIDIGELIKKDRKYKEIWLDIIISLKLYIYDYFKIIFGIIQNKENISVLNPEIITGIESKVFIWTSVNPDRKFFYFEAVYKSSIYNSISIMMEYLSRIFISTVEKYIKYDMLSDITYLVIVKKRDVPFYYYDITNDDMWDSCKDIIDDEMKEKFVSELTDVDYTNSNNTQMATKLYPYYDPEYIEHDDVDSLNIESDNTDKLNETGLGFENKTRDEMIEKLNTINWDDGIFKLDCDFKLYGTGKENGYKYVLYIITQKIQNNEIDTILNDKMKEIFKNTFLYFINYTLYLHKILENNLEINTNREETNQDILVFDITKKKEKAYLNLLQHKEEIHEYINVNMNKETMEYIKIISLQKFINEETIEQTEQYVIEMALKNSTPKISIYDLLITDTIFNGEQLPVYSRMQREIKAFPLILIDNQIFNFIRFLMVTDYKGENPTLLNSFEINTSTKVIEPGPHINRNINRDINDILYSQIAFIISPENIIDIKIPINENIEELKTVKLKSLIKRMIINTLEKSNYFRMVGYLFNWRRTNKRIYNVYDLIASDREYLTLVVNNYMEALVNFINELEIPGFTITKENIEAYFHYPAMNADIHIQFKINKLSYILITNNLYLFSLKKSLNLDIVLELLKINFFKVKEQMCVITPKTVNKLLEMKMKKKKINSDLIKNKMRTEMLTEMPREIEENFQESLLIGGNNNNDSKFLKWIEKYLNRDNIFKIYSLPIVWIEFEIKEETKPIRMEKIYLQYEKCADLKKYNIMEKFYKECLDAKYFKISTHVYNLNILENLLMRKFNKIIYISKIFKKEYNSFYINDKLEITNYKKEYDMLYDLVTIGMTFDFFDINKACKLYLYLKKNIVSLIWALKHLENNGCIELLIRETLIPSSNDLLLLLQQFSSVNIFYDLTFVDGIWITLKIICTDFRDNAILIKHLEKILTLNININTGFLKIKKIIRGDIEKFNKTTLKPSLFLYNRVSEYIDCFKNEDGEFEMINDNIKELIMINSVSLASSNYFIPKPENMPYISSLLHLKKMKIGNKYIDIHSNIKKEEGKILYKLIKDTNATRILEIGMAYGLSSLFILQSLKYFHHKYNNDDVNYRLTSIDPFQSTQWNGYGIQNLKNSKLYANHKLIEEKSYIALPELIKKEKIYDIIFIDGWHTFDYTLNDLFSAFLLVKINGYIVIDDALHPGVNKVVKYIETNYQFLKKIDMDIKTLAIYLKIGDDKREWNFHKDF